MGCIGLIFSTSLLCLGRLGTARETASYSLKLKSGFLGNHMPLCGPWHRPKQSFSSLPKNANIYIHQNYLGTFKKASKGPGRRCNQSSMTLSCLPACTHTHNSQLIWLVLVGETSLWFEWVGQSNPS